MRKITKFDKLIFIGMILLIISIFTLAIVISKDGGQCVINPCQYLEKHNNGTAQCIMQVDSNNNIISLKNLKIENLTP